MPTSGCVIFLKIRRDLYEIQCNLLLRSYGYCPDLRHGCRKRKKIAWYENYAVCPDCYEKARQEEVATAAKQAKADGLPALTGSEKQIRWAESIRKEKMAAAREWLSRYPGEQADKCLAWYGSHASASWWIDHRDERPQRTAKLGVAEWNK